MGARLACETPALGKMETEEEDVLFDPLSQEKERLLAL